MTACHVIKIGGSLAQSAHLLDWLRVINTLADLKVLVIPGGGSFADQVRLQQEKEGFDDETAHVRATLAMGQYGRVLLNIADQSIVAHRFIGVHALEEIEVMFEKGMIPVCLPDADLISIINLPASWETTSDGIAGWFAKKLSAQTLVLVKSITPSSDSLSFQHALAQGLIDSVLPQVAAEGCFETFWLGSDQAAAYFTSSKTDETCGARLV